MNLEKKLTNFRFWFFWKKKSRNFKKWKFSNCVTLIKTPEIEALCHFWNLVKFWRQSVEKQKSYSDSPKWGGKGTFPPHLRRFLYWSFKCRFEHKNHRRFSAPNSTTGELDLKPPLEVTPLFKKSQHLATISKKITPRTKKNQHLEAISKKITPRTKKMQNWSGAKRRKFLGILGYIGAKRQKNLPIFGGDLKKQNPAQTFGKHLRGFAKKITPD